MSSLIHTKNISNPNFKIHDSLTIGTESTRLETKIPNIFAQTHASIPSPHKNNHSILSNTTFCFPTLPEETDSSERRLPIKNFPPKGEQLISIRNLYGVSDISPISHEKKSPMNVTTLRITKFKSLSPPCFRATDAFATLDTSNQPLKSLESPNSKHRRNNKIGASTSIGGDKFQKYLEFLAHSKASRAEASFETRLREKCHAAVAKKPLIENKEHQIPTLVKLPMRLIADQSLALKYRESGNSQIGEDKLGRKNSTNKEKLGLNRRDSQNLSPIMDMKSSPTPVSQKNGGNGHNPKVLSHRNSRMYGIVKKGRECDPNLSELALNLQELYGLLYKHDMKMVATLDELAMNNPKVVNLLLPKFHKSPEYDGAKIEQKFATLEVMTEGMSIPVKLQKAREGLTLIESSVMDELVVLNKKVEEYNMMKREEHLTYVEDKIMQSKSNLLQYQLRMLMNIQKGKSPKTFNALRAFLEKDLDLSGNILYEANLIEAVNEYQRKHGDLKMLDKKKVEQAKNVGRMFVKLLKQSH